MSDSALSNQIMQRIQQMDLPEGVNISQGGNMRMMNDEFNAIYSALATAVFLVFVVMAMQFESMRFSLVVMLSVPFSMTGAFFALMITGQSISMTSLIGLVMLVGIVVNNAIVLIDYANVLRREHGMSARDALVRSVEMMQSMSIVVIGGLTFSTLLTLILIPTVYLLFDGEDRRRKGGQAGKRSLFRRNRREQPQTSEGMAIPPEFR